MPKTKVDNIIFLSDTINIRAGGPSGYIANLKKALETTKTNTKIKFIYMTDDCRKIQKINIFLRLLIALIPIKRYRKKLRNMMSASYSQDTSITSVYYSNFIPQLDEYDFKTIICHCVKDALFIKNYLTDRKIEAKLMFMSHCPEPPSQEIYNGELHAKNPNAEKIRMYWEEMEKKAFYLADFLVFPSKEAIEPYSLSLDYFSDLIKSKKFLFVPTGCNQLSTEKSDYELRNQYNIETPFVISYIGRHNQIKGYDLLKEIGLNLLNKRDDITFLIGGRPSKKIPPLRHERWKELGIINPAEVLKISDAFILSNRQTYFDLILLEVMSMGIPVFASKTGGNKSVYKQTKAISLYETQDECIEKINHFLSKSKEEKEAQKERVLKAYKNHYSLNKFAENYIHLIDSVKN